MALFKKDRLGQLRDEALAKEQAKVHHILVVDDEPENLRVLSDLLADEYHVHQADSGSAALEVLAREPIDMVITDQRMPGMSGVELLGRSLTARPDCVRVILTGYIDVDDVIRAVNQGRVHRYLTKPWDSRELLQAVRRELDASATYLHGRQQTSLVRGIARGILTDVDAIAALADAIAKRPAGGAPGDEAADVEKLCAATLSVHKRVERLLALTGVDVAAGAR